MKIINSKLALHKSGYMKTKTIIYTFLLLLVLTVQRCQCKKDDPIPTPVPQPKPCDTCLPPITTTGQNTFGCRVNGTVWLPEGGSGTPGQSIEYTSNKELVISGYNDSREEFLTLDIRPISDTGNFVFYDSLFVLQGASFLNAKTGLNYYTDTIYHGNIHILRLDPNKGVVSGTFSFDLYDMYHQHNDTIHITDGRFDLHL